MKEKMKNLLYILAGNTIYALAVTLFILPDGLITGGTTGLALFFYHQFGLPIQVFVSAFNVTMFVLGAIVLGKKFALTTIVSTFYYPFILSVFQNMPMIGKMTDDKILAVLFAGLMIGGGIGIVLRAGASTGGTEQEVWNFCFRVYECDGYGDIAFADGLFRPGICALRNLISVDLYHCVE